MIDRWLHRASRVLAVLGGVVLLAAAVMTGVSIAGRWLHDAPIVGDIELMQIACVVAIALFLPWCQWRAEHVRVDFFTQGAGPRLRRALDRAGYLLLAAVMALLAWRAAVGVIDLRASGESTMLLSIPSWLAYLPLLPGLALSALIALRAAWTGEGGEATQAELTYTESTHTESTLPAQPRSGHREDSEHQRPSFRDQGRSEGTLPSTRDRLERP